MMRVGFIVEGDSERIVYESEDFQDLLKREFSVYADRGLGPKESTLPARKMVKKYKFSIENAANHPNCPSAKYFINKLSELNPNL